VKTELQQDDYDALAAFRYAMRKFLRFSKTTLAKAALTPEQYEALLALRASRDPTGVNITALSERLQVKHHTAVSLVGKLVARKLVARTSGASDRRHVNLRLTTAGASILKRMAAIHRRELRSRSAEMIDALVRLQEG
jgi:DNA-binding MarR family transcriptional regulator